MLSIRSFDDISYDANNLRSSTNDKWVVCFAEAVLLPCVWNVKMRAPLAFIAMEKIARISARKIKMATHS